MGTEGRGASDARAADRLKLPSAGIAGGSEGRYSHSWHCQSSTTGMFQESDVSNAAPITPGRDEWRLAPLLASCRQLARGPRDESRHRSRGCRKAVSKASPSRHSVVRSSWKISAKIGVTDRASIAQRLRERKDLDAVGLMAGTRQGLQLW